MAKAPVDDLVYNDNIIGFVVRINRVIGEVVLSESAGVTEYTEVDRIRLESYCADLEAFVDWTVSEPAMDWSKTHPQVLTVPVLADVPEVDNPMVQDVLRLLMRIRVEMIKSKSSQKPSGLISFDKVRVRSYIDRLRRLMKDYVEKVSPIDVPESPSVPQVM